jgi:uncharacterized protein (DUF1501 family)
MSLSRRHFVQLGLAGAGLAAIGPFAGHALAADNKKFVVLVNLDGGNDSLNTVVPLNLGAYHDRRPSISIESPLSLTTGAASTNEYGLHPNLTGLQSLHAEGSLAMIQKVGYPDANHSHFTSKDIFHTGDTTALNANNKTGWVARYASLYNDHSLGCISLGYNAKALQGPDVNLLQLNRLSNFSYNTDGRYSGESDQRLLIAKTMLQRRNIAGNADAVKRAIQAGHQNIERIQQIVETYVPGVEYPGSRFGQSMEDIARLVHGGGLDTDIYYTGLGGFDTHSGQGATGGRHPTLMTTLNDGLSAFATDMKAIGKWQDCVIVVFSEFGRRNFENGSGGTDHGEGQTMLVAGGAVQGGTFGGSLVTADLRDKSSMPMEVDFRQVFSDIIGNHLGKDATPVFPDTNKFASTALGFV